MNKKKCCYNKILSCRALYYSQEYGTYSCMLDYPIKNEQTKNPITKWLYYIPVPKVCCPKPMTYKAYLNAKNYEGDHE